MRPEAGANRSRTADQSGSSAYSNQGETRRAGEQTPAAPTAPTNQATQSNGTSGAAPAATNNAATNQAPQAAPQEAQELTDAEMIALAGKDPTKLIEMFDNGLITADRLNQGVLIALERAMQAETRIYNMFSNALKAEHDRAMAAVNNLR